MNTKQRTKMEMEKRLRRHQERQAKQAVPLFEELPPAQRMRSLNQEIEYLQYAVALLAHRIKAPLTDEQRRKSEADVRRVRREVERLEKFCRGGCTDEELAAFDRCIAPPPVRPKPDLTNVVGLWS